MAGLERQKVLIVDDHNRGGFVNASSAVAVYSGWDVESYTRARTGYQHLTRDIGAVITSFTRAQEKRDRSGQYLWMLMQKATELEIPLAVILKGSTGLPSYDLTGRNVRIPSHSPQLVAPALSNWLAVASLPPEERRLIVPDIEPPVTTPDAHSEVTASSQKLVA